MEVEKSGSNSNNNDNDDDVLLPGFRFHPTDEELVGFYLKRKVEEKPINFDLIRHIDIYKYDPWDLPKISSVGTVLEKEWYFFCRRGRKYRNSIRPNRVTGSGFWKATGIDKPINSVGGLQHNCIGLKKSLVYYRGSAGKGTKTDWMMHEFRLPANKSNNVSNTKNTNIQEAEVWTLCRIFKREVSNKRYPSDWQKTHSEQSHTVSSCVTSSLESSQQSGKYKSFGVLATNENERKPVTDNTYERNQLFAGHQLSLTNYVPFTASHLSSSNPYGDEYFKEGNWDELRPMVDFALDPSLLYSFM